VVGNYAISVDGSTYNRQFIEYTSQYFANQMNLVLMATYKSLNNPKSRLITLKGSPLRLQSPQLSSGTVRQRITINKRKNNMTHIKILLLLLCCAIINLFAQTNDSTSLDPLTNHVFIRASNDITIFFYRFRCQHYAVRYSAPWI